MIKYLIIFEWLRNALNGLSVAEITSDEILEQEIAKITFNPNTEIKYVLRYDPVEYEITQPKVTIKK